MDVRFAVGASRSLDRRKMSPSIGNRMQITFGFLKDGLAGCETVLD